MAKMKNKRIYSDDAERLKTLQEEYTNAGFDSQISKGCLTVFVYRRKKVKPKKEHEDRNKRSEKFAKRD